jgi:SpoVK/Ycf46/Vps4 family AAA+-type ATPase
MLPKLQTLHDRRKVLFVLGTNYVANIDAAIRRPGRFDAILLFDRPDGDARYEAASRVLASKRGVSQGNLDAADRKNAEEIATRTSGWMVEQVLSCAAAVADGRDYPEPSLSDYAEWCRKDGKKELKAAGVEGALRDAVIERWKPFLAIARPPKSKPTAQKRKT